MSNRAPEPGTPHTVIFARLKQCLTRIPFGPFRVVTTSGLAYEVPTADHAGLLPKLRLLTIADDSGRMVEIHTLHVSAIERLIRRRRSPRAA